MEGQWKQLGDIPIKSITSMTGFNGVNGEIATFEWCFFHVFPMGIATEVATGNPPGFTEGPNAQRSGAFPLRRRNSAGTSARSPAGLAPTRNS